MRRVVFAQMFLAAAMATTACAPSRAAESAPVSASSPQAAMAQAVGRPAARHSDRSYYVTMRDGTKIAVNVYFPAGAPGPRRLTAVLMQTRYGRAGIGRWPRTARWLDDGYAVVAVDTRGSTASFGARLTELSPDEIRDMDELVRHVARQPWSDGRVIAAGQSYAADTADLATSRPVKELIGGVLHEVDFDVYLHVFVPGGVVNRGFIADWGAVTRRMDLGRALLPPPAGPALDCLARAADCPKLFPVLQPVDGDESFELLRQALGQKHRWLPDDLLNVAFRDDKGHNGFGLFDISPAAALRGIRERRKPVQYWGSWIDGGTAESALARFRSAPEVPMDVWITANDHNNTRNADPFFLERTEPVPTFAAQQDAAAAFARRLVAGERVERRVHYYVLGTGEMRSTTVWPPVGVETRTFFFAASRSLRPDAGAAGSDPYDVDFDVTTGPETRWSTQNGVPPRYRDRREMDRRLLTYDGAPLERDHEILGTPVLDLRVATRSDDPAFFAYLEDVAPDGTVTYLTEGMLRAIHRRPADPRTLPYDQGPAPHSFRRRDAELVTPGETMQVRFALFPVAARIRAGHRIRIAIAGADTPMFTRYSGGGADTFEVRRGADGSRLELPMRAAD
jgi:putative CocE/NonD family hydrolase